MTVSGTILMAVPNVSEGRDPAVIAAIGSAFSGGLGVACADATVADAGATDLPRPVRLLDVHSDADHHRSVFTLAAAPAELGEGLLAGAGRALALIDVVACDAAGQSGQHPHVGALDVVPIVYLAQQARGAACALALLVADRIGAELEVPVFLYGELTQGVRTRAELRRGGIAGLAGRMAGHDGMRPDYGPARIHPSAGATLLAARQPLVAFNLQLAPPATLADAKAVAASIREGGGQGLPGVRAIGIELSSGLAQVSMNVERPFDVSLAEVVAAVGRHAPIRDAELVGLAPAAALEGFPESVAMPRFDPASHIIENALGC